MGQPYRKKFRGSCEGKAAKGCLIRRAMNGTEERHYDVLEAMLIARQISSFAFEPERLRLGAYDGKVFVPADEWDGTHDESVKILNDQAKARGAKSRNKEIFYTPDFRVVTRRGVVEFHEIKGGHIRDEDMARLKLASRLHPYRFRLFQYRGPKASPIEQVIQ